MDNKLGVIGLGHWFAWLTTGLGVEGGLDLKKAVGTKPFEDKKELLDSFGITRENYYTSDRNGNVPEQFFEGIDIVHISDPNKFHYEQTVDALKHGKYVITEKTLAANAEEFRNLNSFLQSGNYSNKVYLHLHYLHKQPTIELAKALPELIKQNGKIKSVQAAFFEPVNAEDPKRTWLLSMENGGIFMDWVHPYEVVYYTTRCSFGKILELKNFVTNPSYDQNNPTGVEATLELSGENYASGATATMRAAKGVEKKYESKSIKFTFESGAYLMLCFPSHDVEFNTGERGRMELIKEEGNLKKILMSRRFSGSNTSEIFIKEILLFANGEHKGLKMNEIAEIFKPQWEYQEMTKSKELIKDGKQVSLFLDQGIKGMECGK